MSQAVLSPNLTKKFQWEVSQIADKERSLAPLYRWFKCKLKPPKNQQRNPVKHETYSFRKKFQNKISLAQFNSFKIEIKDTVIDFLKRSMFTNNIAVI